MDEEQPKAKEWELPLWWVVVTGLSLWLISGIGLLVYLFGSRNTP